MDSRSNTVLAAGGDKLSNLGDATLGHILSFLPATEAALTATLSRRWRHVFPAVHTLSFCEAESPFAMGYEWWKGCNYCHNDEVLAPHLVTGVTAALAGRHRGRRAATAPLRALRVAFDEFGYQGGDDAPKAVDAWISYAVNNGAAGDGEDGMELDLRLGMKPICDRAYGLCPGGGGGPVVEDDDIVDDEMAEMMEGQDDDMDDDDDDIGDDAAANEDDGTAAANDDEEEESDEPDSDQYVVPRSLFTSCAALHTLRLSNCVIHLPSAITLPSMETLHLTRVTGRKKGAIQRLVSSCPSLVDLTLEACDNLTTLSVDVASRLCRLALRCCHGLATVTVGGSPELRAVEYRGDVPPAALLTTRNKSKIAFCALDFCGVEHGGELLDLGFTGIQRLHVTSARLGSSFVVRCRGRPGACFPCLPMLHVLEITGMLPDDDEYAVERLARVLERTPRLETLSLFFLPEPEPEPVKENHHHWMSVPKDVLDAAHKLRYDPYAHLAGGEIVVPACLRETTREINLVHYQGSVAQRALAKFLLCNAPVVEEVCWKVARGPLSIQTKLLEEVKGWVVNKSANMMFF